MAFGDTGAPTMGQASLITPDPNSYSPTPALAQLEDAYQKGLIGVDEINQLVKNSQDTAANSAQDAATIKVAPQKAALDVGQIQAAKSLIPGQTQLAKTQTAVSQAQAQGQLYPAQYQEKILKQAFSDGQTEATSPGKTSAPGGPSTPSTGNPAADAYRNQFFWDSTPYGQYLKGMATQKNRADLIDPTRSPMEVADAIKSAPTALTGQDLANAREDYNSTLIPQRQQLNRLTGLVNTPGLVGPNVGAGDTLGDKWARVKAWAGLDPTKSADQNQVRQAIGSQIANVMGTVHNIRTQREFDAITAQVPRITDTPQVWNEWLGRAQGILDRAAQSTKDYMAPPDASRLSEWPQAASIPSAPAPPAPPAPAAPATTPAPESPRLPAPAGATLVSTPEEYQKALATLPPGSIIKDPTGKWGHVHPRANQPVAGQ